MFHPFVGVVACHRPLESLERSNDVALGLRFWLIRHECTGIGAIGGFGPGRPRLRSGMLCQRLRPRQDVVVVDECPPAISTIHPDVDGEEIVALACLCRLGGAGDNGDSAIGPHLHPRGGTIRRRFQLCENRTTRMLLAAGIDEGECTCQQLVRGRLVAATDRFGELLGGGEHQVLVAGRAHSCRGTHRLPSR